MSERTTLLFGLGTEESLVASCAFRVVGQVEIIQSFGPGQEPIAGGYFLKTL